ncbi:WhiB family transcriptional regulator [Streptomyces sp. NPDC004365]
MSDPVLPAERRRVRWRARQSASEAVSDLFCAAATAVHGVQGCAVLTWHEKAACRDCDTDLFFPISMQGAGRRQADEAKAVCSMCSVREQCADWAVDTAQQYGIWGGMDEAELAQATRTASRSRLQRRPAQ